MNLSENQIYKKWFKNTWPYITGAVLLSVIQIASLASTNEFWGVSTGFTYWGAWLYELVGGSVDQWHFFNNPEVQDTLEKGFLINPISIRNLGVIVGALLATLMASEFRIRKIKSIKSIIAASLGGFLMGYGARIASGCNIGALYSGIASLSLSGWVFGVFIFLGAIIGSKLLIRYLM